MTHNFCPAMQAVMDASIKHGQCRFEMKPQKKVFIQKLTDFQKSSKIDIQIYEIRIQNIQELKIPKILRQHSSLGQD
jgi:hypothetical protein